MLPDKTITIGGIIFFLIPFTLIILWWLDFPIAKSIIKIWVWLSVIMVGLGELIALLATILIVGAFFVAWFYKKVYCKVKARYTNPYIKR